MTSNRHVALSVLASVDPVLRESTTLDLVLGSPGTVVVRHDIRRGASRPT
jgi:hypothetical protein